MAAEIAESENGDGLANDDPAARNEVCWFYMLYHRVVNEPS